MNIEDVQTRAVPFVRSHGVLGDFHAERIPAGGNNRVYRLRTTSGDRVLKVYFKGPSDSRDRLGAERSFYELVWRQGVRRTPEPFGWDAENQLGLFSFIEGRKLEPGEVSAETVGQVLDFVIELNRARQEAEAGEMPMASESCFRIEDHLECVQRRVARLRQIEATSAVDSEALDFVQSLLEPAWEKVRASISKASREASGAVLSEKERCLSPSDFGFHNALLAADGKLRFFDFEYAGWDDPAKLVCDFFCQPQIPVSKRHWDGFVDKLSSGLSGALVRHRAELLFPAYQIKWCCIMLNEFSRTDSARRQFAIGTGDERKAAQLERASQALEAVQV